MSTIAHRFTRTVHALVRSLHMHCAATNATITTTAAATVMQSAAKAGHAEAMATLGGVYEGGGRLSSALQWYQLAAAPGEGGANNARAQVGAAYYTTMKYILCTTIVYDVVYATAQVSAVSGRLNTRCSRTNKCRNVRSSSHSINTITSGSSSSDNCCACNCNAQ
jgi:hypothetical protein